MWKRDAIIYSWLMKPRYLTIAIVVIFFIVAGAAFFLICHNYSKAKKIRLVSDKTTASLLSRMMAERQRATIGMLQSCAKSISVIDIQKEGNRQAIISHLRQLVEKFDDTDRAFVVDRKGALLTYYPVDSSNKIDLSDSDWYRGVSKRWEPFVSDSFRMVVAPYTLVISICTPITDRDKKVIGVMGIASSVVSLSSCIHEAVLRETESVTIIDGKGHIIYSNTHPDPDRLERHPLFQSIREAVDKKRFSLVSEEGTRYISVAPVKTSGWTVVVESSRSRIFRENMGRLTFIALFSALCFILIVMVLMLLKRGRNLSNMGLLFEMEKKLRAEEENFGELFEHMTSGVAVYEAVDDGADFVIRAFNRAGEEIEGVIRDDVIGRRVTEAFPGVKDFGLFKVFQRVYRTGRTEYFPDAVYRDDLHQDRWRENWVYRLSSGEIVAIYNDITERVKAEEFLIASIEEKEILLREIHHRVKNNLTVISSLLYMQLQRTNNPEVLEIFSSSCNRIRTMAMIHTRLYGSADMKSINFGEHIMDIAAQCLSSHTMPDCRIRFSFNLDETVYTDLTDAIPLGLIVNELVTNAVKYAFPQGGEQRGDRENIISISLKRQGRDLSESGIEGTSPPVPGSQPVDSHDIVLIVSDNGIGLPEDEETEDASSLGLFLVRALTKQIGATLDVKRERGTTFVISFERRGN